MAEYFKAASYVIEAATKRFNPEWVIDNGKLEILAEYISVFDYIGREFNGKEFMTEVNYDTKEIMISMECPILIVDDRSRIINELIKRSISVTISTTKKIDLKIGFTFPSLWNKVK